MQVWGGSFYLLNKIFFSRKERTIGERSRMWRIWAWIVYILGLPFWLVILAHEKDWMVTFVEAGGLPSMLLGLTLAFQRKHQDSTALTRKLRVILDRFAVVSAVLGIGYSLYHFG